MAPFLATTVFLLPEAISSSLHQMRTRTNLSGVLSSNGRKGRRRRQKRDRGKRTPNLTGRLLTMQTLDVLIGR